MTPLEALTHARAHGISPSMLHALLAVAADEGASSVSITKATGMMVGAAGTVLGLLHRDGWVIHDRRLRSITLTPKGEGFVGETESPKP